MSKKKRPRDISAEILEGTRELKRGKIGRVVKMDSELQKHYEVRARQAHRWHEQARNFICDANRLVDRYILVMSSQAASDMTALQHEASRV